MLVSSNVEVRTVREHLESMGLDPKQLARVTDTTLSLLTGPFRFGSSQGGALQGSAGGDIIMSAKQT